MDDKTLDIRQQRTVVRLLLGESFQIVVQGGRTQVEPGRPPDLEKETEDLRRAIQIQEKTAEEKREAQSEALRDVQTVAFKCAAES